ncbi:MULTISPECIES: hypothetical protein [unclassified Rhizobium]|uniref:hypothetical protein n=1 Tax=unclassified Rhizobium TaxID=2613769 RepID=UPI001ADC9179|nr:MULTISPECIES: hypothetical protein [unclassified Rhizobium]MBO9125896.1 hypothetical protein [Rhizobium sp. 16-488-2b]MBO9176480.1 hypothetical protein [Rhizobium sp. 16-488-2a]
MPFTITKSIPARERWTRVCDIRQGATYAFTASGTWTDWKIDEDANGYDRTWLRPFTGLRVMPKAQWFALIGSIDQDTETAFLIGASYPSWIAPKNGVLYCCANDIPWMYWNNSGAVELTCTEL